MQIGRLNAIYSSPVFQESDPEAIRSFIRQHPLGMITAAGESGLVATHVPLLIEGDGDQIRLRGHVMRKTPHWEGFKNSSEVLIAFTGPNAVLSRLEWVLLGLLDFGRATL